MSTNEWARVRRAFTTKLPFARTRADCPAPTRIWQGVRDELSPSQLRELIHHISICSICTEAWKVAEKLEGRRGGIAPPRRPDASLWGGLRIVGIAAAAALMLTFGSLIYDRLLYEALSDKGYDSSTFRAPDGPTIERRSGQPDNPLKRDNCVLSWNGPKNTAYYSLRVTWADKPSVPLAEESKVEEPEFLLPPEALTAIPRNAKMQLHIEAFDATEAKLVGATLDFYLE